MNKNQMLVTKKIGYFYLVLLIKLNKTMRLLINSLRVAYGIQIQLYGQDFSNWYTAKVLNHFFVYKTYLIQVTDSLFIVKPIIDDFKQIFGSSVLVAINFLSLKKLRNNLSNKVDFLYKTVLYYLQTFLFQIDEDGEDVLARIKQINIFRRQKPGNYLFLKEPMNVGEDSSFLGLRFLRKKFSFFIKMIALLFLPYLFYQTNKQSHFSLNKENLAFVLGNRNTEHLHTNDKNRWNHSIDKNIINEDLNIYNLQKNIQSANLIKPHSFNNILKFSKLWNINKKFNDLKFIDYKIDDIILHNQIDDFSYNEFSMSNQNFHIPTIKKIENFANKLIIDVTYKYAFLLIKPIYNDKLLSKVYSQNLQKKNIFDLIKNKYVILYSISDMKNESFFLKKLKSTLLKSMSINFFEIKDFNLERASLFLEKIFYTNNLYSQKYFILVKNNLKNNRNYLFLNSNSLLTQNEFNNELLSLLQRYLKIFININEAYIKYYLNQANGIYSIKDTNLFVRYTLLSKYINRDSIDIYSVNDRFDQSILFKTHKDWSDFNANLFINFSELNSNKTFSFNILNVLDEIHLNLRENCFFLTGYKTYEKTRNIVSLYNHILLNRPDFLQDYISSNTILQYLSTFKNIESEIYKIFINKQIQITSILNKYLSKEKNNNWVLNTNLNLSITDNNVNSLYCFNIINLLKSLNDLKKININSHSFVTDYNVNLSYSVENQLTKHKLPFHVESGNTNDKLNLLSYGKTQTEFIRNYSSWFFTKEWWFLLTNLGKKIFLMGLQNLENYTDALNINIQMLLNTHLLNNDFFAVQKIFSLVIKNKTLKININDSSNSNKIPIQISLESLSIWDNIRYIGSLKLNITQCAISIISFISYYWFSVLLGGSTLLIWLCFEKIKSLTYLSWNTELNLLILKNLEDHKSLILPYSNKRNNSFKEQYNLSRQIWSVRIRFVLSKITCTLFEFIWLKSNPLDLYTNQRNLALQFIIPEKNLFDLSLLTLDDKIMIKNNDIPLTQEGLDLLKKPNAFFPWDKIKKNITIENQKFINLSFYKNSNRLLDIFNINKSEIEKTQYVPISLELCNLYSRATLLIGPQDTGKSYLVKSLASDRNLPIVYFSLTKLIDMVEFEDNFLETDSSLYFTRENLVKFYAISSFITKMPQCVIWMPDIDIIHRPDDFMSKSKEELIFIMLRVLLKNITHYIKNYPNLIFFASCENVNYLDPGFISTERFDRLINLRIPSSSQRPQIFLNFLKKHNLSIKTNNNWYSEFMNNTIGFTLRDLVYLANQVALTKLQTNIQDFDYKNLRLTVYKGMRATENISQDVISTNDLLVYKIGRAIIQATLVRPNPMILIQSRYELWKPRFYYLSKAYLERDYLESTITQLNIMTHILNCLSGCAAKDAYLSFTKDKFNENLFDFNIELQHDLDIAINLFESIFREFSHFEILNKFSLIPNVNNNFHLINNENYTIPKRNLNMTNTLKTFSSDKEFSNQSQDNISLSISWSINIERLSLSRNILFDILKNNDELLSTFSTKRYFNTIQHNSVLFEKERPYDSIYHRSWDIMQPLIPKDIDYYFYNLLLKQRLSIMGLPIDSNELLEYERQEDNLLFIQGRFVWNPVDTFLRNLIFRQRDLFVHEELLSILYILYQSQQPKPSIYKNTQRKKIWNPDAYLEKVAMKKQTEQNKNTKKIMDDMYTFNSLQKLAHANAVFQRPSTEIPDKSEMSFTKRFIASNRFSRFSLTEDIFSQRNKNDKTFRELLIYGVIIESYYELVQFFIKHRHLSIQIKNILLEKSILFEEDLEKIIYNNIYTNTLM